MSPTLVINALYTFIFATYAVLASFAPLILREHGLGDGEISIALSMVGLAALLSPLIVSHFADGRLAVRHILTSLLIVDLLIVPFWLTANTLVLAALVTFAYFACILPVLILFDAYTVAHALKQQKSDPGAREYHSYRIWGSVGFMFPATMLYLFSLWIEIDSQVLVAICIFFFLLSIFFTRFLPKDLPARSKTSRPTAEAIQAAIHPPLRGIFLATTVTGFALAIFYITYPRFLQELGNSPQTIGVILNLGVLSEVLMIPFTGWFVRRFTARTVVLAGLCSLPVRLLLVCAWPSTFMIVATQWLHGPLVVGLMVCIPIMLGQAAKESYRYSLQSLNSALTLGAARLTGPWLGALVLHLSTGSSFDAIRSTLLISALLGTIGFSILFVSRTVRKGSPGFDIDNVPHPVE